MQLLRTFSLLFLALVASAHAQTYAPAAPRSTPRPALSSEPVPVAAPIDPALGSTPATIVGSSTGMRPITLEEAIMLAVEHNFDVQIQRYSPEIARYQLGMSYGAYDPTMFASGRHSYSLSPGGIDQQARAFQGAETESDSFSAGLNGLLPWGMTYNVTGTTTDSYGTRPGTGFDFNQVLNVQTNYLRDANNPNNVFFFTTTNFVTVPTRSPFENATANVGAMTLSQPLLKNFWIDPTRANIQVARNRLKQSEQALRFQLMLTISAVEQAYYNLIFARENVKVQEKALELVERLLLENRKKVEVGAMAPLDEKQAESQVASSRADLIAAQRSMDQQENVLKNLITDQYAEWQGVNLVPGETLTAVPEMLSLQESWNKGLSQRPDLAQARLDLQNSDINLKLDKNQLFPDLNLIGQYGYAGSGSEFSRALGQIRETENPFWYYGAQISYPLGSRTARNNLKISKAQKEQTKLILKQKEQQVMVEIDDAVKQVQSTFGRVEATRQARLFAEAALDAEQKKLENGKSTSFFVLQFQRDVTSARFAEIRALAEYNNALAQLAFREGATLERHKISLTLK